MDFFQLGQVHYQERPGVVLGETATQNTSMRDSPTIQKFVEDLSAANVITKTKYVWFAARLSMFNVPKKNSDKVRIILDLSPLNKFIFCPTFRMTTTGDIMRLLPRDCYAASIDIKDAYWHIPMLPAV